LGGKKNSKDNRTKNATSATPFNEKKSEDADQEIREQIGGFFLSGEKSQREGVQEKCSSKEVILRDLDQLEGERRH